MEIYYQDPIWYKQVLKRVKNSFTEGNISIKGISIKGFGEGLLELKADTNNMLQVSNNFVETLKAKLDLLTPGVTYACLFELNGRDYFKNKKLIDPKKLIRKAFACTGRLTQFIEPLYNDDLIDLEEKKDIHRLNSAVLDLQRQIGMINSDISSLLKLDTAHVGIWWFKKQKGKDKKIFDGANIPILVAVINSKVFMNIPDEINDWVPYSEGLLELGKINNFPLVKDKFERDKIIEKYNSQIYFSIKKLCMREEVQQVIIYTRAQNSRSFMWGLQNPKVNTQYIQLTNTNPLPIKDYVMVRVRDEESFEAPEWVSYGRLKNESDDKTREIPESFQAGLYKLSEHIYFSIAGKPNSAKSMQYSKTKVDKPSEAFRKETALEICIPYIKDGMDAEEIAKAVHRLREKMLIQYDKDFTIMPLPLHLAKKAGEYAITINSDEEQESLDEKE